MLAQEDRSHLELRPEERIAARTIREAGMSPPVNVLRLVRAVADVERVELPIVADALLLHATRDRRRPLVLLSTKCTGLRARFTLAHELGHLAIPWHIGEVAFTLEDDPVGDLYHAQEEAEANRFASELLMPAAWVRQIVQDTGDIEAAVHSVTCAKVSLAAANWAVFRSAGPGSIVATVDSKNTVVRASRSPGTYAYPPSEGSQIDAKCFGELPIGYWVIPSAGCSYHWWRFATSSVQDLESSGLSARDILVSILLELGIEGGASSKRFGSIMAVTGHWKGNAELHKQGAGAYLAVFRQRFAGDEDEVIRHPRFDDYLRERAIELAGK